MKDKVLILDFDGTITQKGQNVWRMLWEEIGYSTEKNSLYAKLYIEHIIQKKITRKEWFDKTCDAFKQKNMSIDHLNKVNKMQKIKPFFKETIKKLYDNNFYIIILSGSLTNSIRDVLGQCNKYIPMVVSNRAIFNKNGKLTKIIPSAFDYAGKAEFIELIKKRFNLKSQNIYFVGNDYNDEWVKSTGCKTFCISPENTQSTNKSIWSHNISSFSELANSILNNSDQSQIIK